MPYADAVGNILRYTEAFTNVNSQIQECNVNFVVTAQAGGLDFRTNLQTAVENLWVTYWAATANTAQKLYGSKLSCIWPRPPAAPLTTVRNIPGVQTGGLIPTQVRPLLRWQTALAGRKYRGRMFLPTPDFDFVNQVLNNPTNGLLLAMTALGTGINTIFTYTSGASFTSYTPCIAHRLAGPPVTWTYDLVIGTSNNQNFATQWKSGGTGRVNALPW